MTNTAPRVKALTERRDLIVRAIISHVVDDDPSTPEELADNIIAALEPQEAEPVAWRVVWFDGTVEVTDDKECFAFNPQVPPRFEPLYAAPVPASEKAAAVIEAEIIGEHSGCGQGIQVDQLTVRLAPGDKVYVVRSALGRALIPATHERSVKALIARLWPNSLLGPKSFDEIAVFIEEERQAEREYRASSHPVQGWQDSATAPKNGDEFIARCGSNKPAFSCFWNGDAFVHYEDGEGFIAYPFTEWMPFPLLAGPSSKDGDAA